MKDNQKIYYFTNLRKFFHFNHTLPAFNEYIYADIFHGVNDNGWVVVSRCDHQSNLFDKYMNCFGLSEFECYAQHKANYIEEFFISLPEGLEIGRFKTKINNTKMKFKIIADEIFDTHFPNIHIAHYFILKREFDEKCQIKC